MQVTSLQILLSYSYTQKKSEREKRGEKKQTNVYLQLLNWSVPSFPQI